VQGTTAKSASGAANTKGKKVSSELLEAEDWPKGLYMIFIKEDDDSRMGKVIGLTQTKALIHPWSFMFGGVDEELTIEVVLADQVAFFAFDDIWEMDDYFHEHYWNPMLDKNITAGTIV
jgi:hypothetical protein